MAIELLIVKCKSSLKEPISLRELTIPVQKVHQSQRNTSDDNPMDRFNYKALHSAQVDIFCKRLNSSIFIMQLI